MYRVLAVFALLIMINQADAQDLEPRRWTPIPAGVNVVGAGYVGLQGDVLFNPVLRIEDTDVSGHVVAVSYVRSFKIASKLARFDVVVPWKNMRWSGLLDGDPAIAKRVGLADPVFRVSVLLAGVPASDAAANEGKKSNTIFGAAIAVSVPVGEYESDKLLNLGKNRSFIRPQLGVLHTRGKWSYELTGSTFIYGDNDDFFGGLKLEQDPLYALQGHVVRVFEKPGYWAALSTGYAWNGENKIDGAPSNDSQKLWLSSLAIGIPLGKRQGMKFAYLRSRTKNNVGADIDSLAIGWSYIF
jgi:hypothetical protein